MVWIYIGICVLLLMIWFVSAKNKKANENVEKAKCDNIIKECEKLKLDGLISDSDLNDIKGKINNKGSEWGKKTMDFAVSENKILNSLISMYGEEKGKKIFNNVYFLGMTTDELINAKRYKAEHIEIEVMKTKTKETWIYGNKSSGDVFVFENGILVRFKDR